MQVEVLQDVLLLPLLLMHEGSGVTAWCRKREGHLHAQGDILLSGRQQHCLAGRCDNRRQKVLAVAPNAPANGSKDAGRITCACWVGDAGRAFATGHERGAVRLWSMPPEARDSGERHL